MGSNLCMEGHGGRVSRTLRPGSIGDERGGALRGPLLYSGSMARRFHFRPPGLKPTTKVGTLGPYRGRLGLAWVIAPIVAGAIIVVAGYVALTR